MKGTPNTFGLSSPIANEITSKNKTEVTTGPIKVCPATIIKRSTSFLYNEKAPTQFIKPNLLLPI